MNVGFFKRLLAYFLDIIIVFVIVGIISMGIKTSATKYQEQLSDTMTSYLNGEITIEDYTTKINDLTYEIQKRSVVTNTVNIVMTLGYFVVFQYLNKGQTIGKKIMKIKVTSMDDKNPSIVSYFLRSIVLFNIISSLFNVIFINFLAKDTFITSCGAITMIENIVLFLTAIFILYRKDKRGIQDIIARTKVIEERR